MFKYRTEDPRVARFFAVDPIAAKYPELTPYQVASLSPIGKLEIEGLEGEWKFNVQTSQEKAEAALDNGASKKEAHKVFNESMNMLNPLRTPEVDLQIELEATAGAQIGISGEIGGIGVGFKLNGGSSGYVYNSSEGASNLYTEGGEIQVGSFKYGTESGVYYPGTSPALKPEGSAVSFDKDYVQYGTPLAYVNTTTVTQLETYIQPPKKPVRVGAGGASDLGAANQHYLDNRDINPNYMSKTQAESVEGSFFSFEFRALIGLRVEIKGVVNEETVENASE